MPKMTVRVILKSGVEFSIKCDKFTLTRNGFQQVTGYNSDAERGLGVDFDGVISAEALETSRLPSSSSTR